jgi:ribonucleotide monophosphatase NagD (HAD superfamily)
MIGDQIETDIKGARAFGLDTVLYTRGVTNPASVKFVVGSDSCPDFLLDDLWSGEPDR